MRTLVVVGRAQYVARRTDGPVRVAEHGTDHGIDHDTDDDSDDQEPGVPRTHLDVAASFDVPASAAWRLLTDTRTWPLWGPTLTAVEADPPVIDHGSTGRLRTPVGLWLPFVVTVFDPGSRWSWRVAGVPATGHRVEATSGGCRVVFEVPLVVAPYAAVCRLALRRIGDLLGAESS